MHNPLPPHILPILLCCRGFFGFRPEWHKGHNISLASPLSVIYHHHCNRNSCSVGRHRRLEKRCTICKKNIYIYQCRVVFIFSCVFMMFANRTPPPNHPVSLLPYVYMCVDRQRIQHVCPTFRTAVLLFLSDRFLFQLYNYRER